MTMVDGQLQYQVVVMSALVDICKMLFCCTALPYHIYNTPVRAAARCCLRR